MTTTLTLGNRRPCRWRTACRQRPHFHGCVGAFLTGKCARGHHHIGERDNRDAQSGQHQCDDDLDVPKPRNPTAGSSRLTSPTRSMSVKNSPTRVATASPSSGPGIRLEILREISDRTTTIVAMRIV